MNVASWIIFAVVIVWIGLAVKSAFFGSSKKGSCHGGCDDDEKYKLPSACAGCSKGSCAGCSSAGRDVPTPIIHELETPPQATERRS